MMDKDVAERVGGIEPIFIAEDFPIRPERFADPRYARFTGQSFFLFWEDDAYGSGVELPKRPCRQKIALTCDPRRKSERLDENVLGDAFIQPIRAHKFEINLAAKNIVIVPE